MHKSEHIFFLFLLQKLQFRYRKSDGLCERKRENLNMNTQAITINIMCATRGIFNFWCYTNSTQGKSAYQQRMYGVGCIWCFHCNRPLLFILKFQKWSGKETERKWTIINHSYSMRMRWMRAITFHFIHIYVCTVVNNAHTVHITLQHIFVRYTKTKPRSHTIEKNLKIWLQLISM